MYRIVVPAVLTAAVLGARPEHVWADTEPFDYFQNSWSVIGLKDYLRGSRITPANELLLSGNRKVRFRFGRDLVRLSRDQVKTNLDGWLPVVTVQATDEAVRYRVTFWATPLPTVPDYRAAYNWPVAGENFLNWITVQVANTGTAPATAKVRVEFVDGDKLRHVQREWTLEPAPASAVTEVFRLPFEPVADSSKWDQEDPQVWLARTVEFWNDAVLKGTRITVPCEKSTQALLAAHVCQLIASDHGEVHGGEGFYDEFYIRDGAYQVMELEEAGLMDAAWLAVSKYLEKQRPDGRFETQKGQFDANGQAVWTLWQYWKITGDRDFLARAYPQMRKAVDWTMQARRQSPADSPFAGVLPNAVADGEYLWDGKHHIVGYDLWNLRGMLCTADAARALGRNNEAAELLEEAESYRTAIDAAHRRTGVPYFPPSWEKKGTHWGNTETLWPTELFEPQDPRVAALIRQVRERHGGGFCEGTIRWTGFPDVIHPYMSAYSTMAGLVRGDHEQVVEDYYWYLLHSTATHAFPEGIFFKRRFAWSETIPHVTGACNFAIMLRHMLIHETARPAAGGGGELHLLLALPDWWLEKGREIRVERAPTHFGTLDLKVTGEAEGVRVRLVGPSERPPGRMVLHLPRHRPLIDAIDGVGVVYREPQKKRWDFRAVVNEYLKSAPPLARRIPGLVDLPVEELPEDRVKAIDLSRLANTDPFTAPFGVTDVGRLVFKDMPVGRQSIAGVPFEILDPRRNQGRGFVVLHSPSAPPERAFPTQVVIPVGEQGRRLFFLGNVSGWGGNDAGSGAWGAIAEYEIRYADGRIQVVPLITGRTVEDWTIPPAATDLFCGLRGDPWHLNVLGVQLRPVKVDHIVFRDLGTPAAPVLAAVSLEK